MSRRVGNVTIIEATPPAQCELCGAVEELRPYGPNGESICFKCAQRTPEATEKQMARILFGNLCDKCGSSPLKLCDKCGSNPKQKSHVCPYAVEVGDDCKTLCECCEQCEQRCKDDI
ncbi:MAG: hypothetical protein L0Z53_18770 [Acidobacteriales bacterium]|nr:hypothetical protein [Terriglobales bacterium]